MPVPPFVSLVQESHRRLSRSPVYHSRLFPVERYFPAVDTSASSSPAPPPPTLTLPHITSEINQLSYYYQLRCNALRANVDGLAVAVPSIDAGRSSLAFALACLLRTRHRDTFDAALDDALKTRVNAAFSAEHAPAAAAAAAAGDAPSTGDATSAIALTAEGMSAEVLSQLQRLLDVVDEMDDLRTFCLTSSMQAASALALLDPPLSTASPLLSSPFALSHHLSEANCTVQALLDGFLPRPSASSLCPLSSLTIALPVTLTSCRHRFELLSVLTSAAVPSERRCPLCAHSIDLELDQLIADSAMLRLEDKEKDEALPVDAPVPVPSPVLTLSSMSDNNGKTQQQQLDGVVHSTAHASAQAARQLVLPAAHKVDLGAADHDNDERGVSCHQVRTFPSNLRRR